MLPLTKTKLNKRRRTVEALLKNSVHFGYTCDREINMSLSASDRKSVVAMLAALILLLQALLPGLGFGTYRGPSSFDTFSDICLSSGAASQSQDIPDRTGDAVHADCCVLCSVSGLDTTVDRRDLPIVAFDLRLLASVPRDDLARSGTIERLPGYPRAPPRFTI
jgi:hypothetical protein